MAIYGALYRKKFVGAQYHGEYSNNVWEIFMCAKNNVWAHVGIFVSGLMKLRPENLYLNI